MKFGKQIRFVAVKQWYDHYIPYHDLKKMIKQMLFRIQETCEITSNDDIKRLFKLNCEVPYRLIKLAVPYMKKRRWVCAAMAAVMAAGGLAGCGQGNDAAGNGGEGNRELVIYTWDLMFPDEMLDQFEEDTGISFI